MENTPRVHNMTKRWSLVVILCVLMAACSSVDPDKDIPSRPSAAGKEVDDLIARPLQVPDMAALPDTPERRLDGGLVPVTYQALPDWASDDLSDVWQAFIHNCKGLMRPISGNLTQPARATPRAWQPVCQAAQQAEIDSTDSARVRSFIEEHLQPWRLLGADGKPASNTVTGYYEPEVSGARNQNGDYQWPLYETPRDLLTIDLGGSILSWPASAFAASWRDSGSCPTTPVPTLRHRAVASPPSLPG